MAIWAVPKFFLLATAGERRFFREESGILDCYVGPLKFGGYAIGYRGGHAQVRIERGGYGKGFGPMAGAGNKASRELVPGRVRPLAA